MNQPDPCGATVFTACIGSNAPDAGVRIEAAMRFLEKAAGASEVSATEVFHCSGSQYGNALMRFRSPLSLGELLPLTKEYERMAGRLPEHKAAGVVLIDIDIVMAGERVLGDDYYSPYFTEGLDKLGGL